MSDENDLFGRTEALFKRHALSAAPERGDSAAVPVLRDLVSSDPAQPASMQSDISQEVFMHVMAEIEGRLASVLGKRLTEHLTAEVQVAVAAALSDTRQELANAIGDAVAEALRHHQVK
jgi:hypothetical protein